MKWIIENMPIIESALQSLWYLVFVASAIVLILMGVSEGGVVAVTLGVVGLLVIMFSETLKAFKALKKKGGID